MTTSNHFIAVVSKDHLNNGIKGGFMQANHGKITPLKKIKQNDWIIFYSPKQKFNGAEKCQTFTAIGQAVDDVIYEYEMDPNFKPFRRNIRFYHCKETPIQHLIQDLDFIKDKTRWGFMFRFGFFKIEQSDFDKISSLMLTK